MRGTVLAVVTVTTLLISSQFAKAEETFVDRCLGQTPVLKSQIECRIRDSDGRSVLRFVLSRGQAMTVIATGRFGNYTKNMAVERIAHLPPRITDLGVMDESVRFLGKATFGLVTATITIPCNQADYAAIGIDRTATQLPSEHIAECLAQ